MLSLTEWLTIVGFQGGNPFASKQADDEDDQLEAYFVEHPAYNAILDDISPHNTILHAARGAGKSTSRRMFQAHCLHHPTTFHTFHPLLVELTDWNALVEHAGTITAVRAEHYVEELLAQTLVALAQAPSAQWLRAPADADLAGYLNWMTLSYLHYLSPQERQVLEQRGWAAEPSISALTSYDMRRVPVSRRIKLLNAVIQSIGFTTCYILIDRIDELPETVADALAGAQMLEPLIANLSLIEVRGLAFKWFIPSEIFKVLEQRGTVRPDRIKCFELQWSGESGRALLLKMLQSRLDYFSHGRVHSLASIAIQDLRDIDERLTRAAQGSPRRLLNLGESLFEACALTADSNDVLINWSHLEAALANVDSWVQRAALFVPEGASVAPSALPQRSDGAASRPSSLVAGDVTRASTAPAALAEAPDPEANVPLLRIKDDGSIWRGTTEIQGWSDLPALQRSFLQYLYENRGLLCRKDDILKSVWQDKTFSAGEDALRKLAQRAINFIEPDPGHPVYIKKIRGGHYCLLNAVDRDT